MERRLFLQFPRVASALMANAQRAHTSRVKNGFKVGAGKDRFQEEILNHLQASQHFLFAIGTKK